MQEASFHLDFYNLPEENIWGHRKKLEYLLSVISDIRNQKEGVLRILDFGCGNGSAVTKYLAQIKGVTVLGVDLHEPSLKYAKENFAKENCKFTSVLEGEDLFDVIVYADVLEHLDDPFEVLRGHYKFLSEYGVVVGAIPNGYGPFEIESWLDRKLNITSLINVFRRVRNVIRNQAQKQRGQGDDLIPYNHESGHVQFFTKSSLTRALSDAGFKLVDFKNGVILGANISGIFLGRCAWFLKFNRQAASQLPSLIVSTWYFTAAKKRC